MMAFHALSMIMVSNHISSPSLCNILAIVTHRATVRTTIDDLKSNNITPQRQIMLFQH